MLFTIGHSNRPVEQFLAMLKAFEIETLVDIRTIPRSRYNPQFNGDALAQSLAASQITYRHMKELGGLRKPRPDSINSGWRNNSFRGYADYMQTDEFRKALEEIIALSKHTRLVLMCAESVPWRCHRSLVADALVARHMEVEHILSETSAKPHAMTDFARIVGDGIIYAPEKEKELFD